MMWSLSGRYIVAAAFVVWMPKSTTVVVGQNLTDPSTVQIGDSICFEGYVMDYYCIDRGTLLDNPSVSTLVGPEEHTLHCLVDIDECTSSPFEILGDPSGDGENDDVLYTRAYRVDDSGRSTLIDLARQHGKPSGCGTCTGSSESENTELLKRGFRAEIYGTVTALASTSDDVLVPVQIQLTSASRSNGKATICGAANGRLTSAPLPSPTGSDTNESGVESRSRSTGINVVSAVSVIAVVVLVLLSLYSGLASSIPSFSPTTTK